MQSGLSKWIVDLSSDATPGEWALHSVCLRLDAVRSCLPAAARKADRNSEYVHQLRVATRRAAAALSVYRELLPPRRTRRIRTLLRTVRRAAGHARDLDVMLLRHRQNQRGTEARRFLELVHQDRRMAQQELLEVRDALKSAGGLKRQFAGYCDHVRRRIRRTSDSTGPFCEWASQRLQRLLQEFLAVVPDATSSEADLHEFRIRGKQLRYAMELLSVGFPSGFRDELYPRLEDLLEQLGAVHDHTVAIEYFRHWLNTPHRRSLQRHLQRLIERESADLQVLLSRFRHRWNAESFRDLAAAFEVILYGSDNSSATLTGISLTRD